ncbi:hypothetical protein EII25_04190 [Erysipelotrichaceae bacterium OH741_COT-311]|nr:hypothetical protein EII25_04190 [Erysipelotrichaceae bacterium OH741_COT-311]
MKVDRLYVKGDGILNEDVIGFHFNVYWVIDGATQLFDDEYCQMNGGVYWLVNKVNRLLPSYINDKDSLKTILSNVLQDVKKSVDGYEDIEALYKLPSFAITMIRVHEHYLEYYALGDCGLVVDDLHIVDARLMHYSNAKKIEYAHLEPLELSQKIREGLNVDYWIGTIDGLGISKGLTGIIPIHKESKILLFTDGLLKVLEYHQLGLHQVAYDFVRIKELVAYTFFNRDNLEAKNSLKTLDDTSAISIELAY